MAVLSVAVLSVAVAGLSVQCRPWRQLPLQCHQSRRTGAILAESSEASAPPPSYKTCIQLYRSEIKSRDHAVCASLPSLPPPPPTPLSYPLSPLAFSFPTSSHTLSPPLPSPPGHSARPAGRVAAWCGGPARWAAAGPARAAAGGCRGRDALAVRAAQVRRAQGRGGAIELASCLER